MDVEETRKYEELYRKCWIKQTTQDFKDNPKLQLISPQARSGFKNNARAGGRKKKKPIEVDVFAAPLPTQVAIINRMVLRNMTHGEIGRILDVAFQSVTHTVKKYKLPRKED